MPTVNLYGVDCAENKLQSYRWHRLTQHNYLRRPDPLITG